MNRGGTPWGWVFGLLGMTVGAVFAYRARELAHAPRPLRVEVADTPSSAAELRALKEAVAALDRKSNALAAAVAATPLPSAPADAHGEAPPSAAPAASADTRSEAELHDEMIADLEEMLGSQTGNPQEQRSAATAVQRELGAAPLGSARVVDVQCAPSLCKAVIEEDTRSENAMDLRAVIYATPSIRHEAVFDYEHDGSLKRTIVYAAREGHHLMPAPASTQGSP